MNTRSSALAAVLALAAAVPAAASAAQIQTDRSCYQDNTGTVAVCGNGFEPSQPYQVTLDGQAAAGRHRHDRRRRRHRRLVPHA